MTPEIGDRVVYTPWPGAAPEYGIVTATHEPLAFVRYDGDTHSKATPFDLLEDLPGCGHQTRTPGCGGCDPCAGATFITVAAKASAPDMLCIVGEMNGEPHEPHDWWYTAWGGGHQCDHDITDDPREKRVKAWHCPGIEGRTP